MHIQTINYTRTFNLGNYSSEKIGVEFALNEGESANKALDYARELVEQYHSENVKRLRLLGQLNDCNEEPIEIIKTQSKQSLAEKTIQFIKECKSVKELKAWELMAKTDPLIYSAYSAKLNTL
jgi:N12 class adenine-specific DNA methylase